MLRPRAGSSSAGMRTSNSACACPRPSYTPTTYSPLSRNLGPPVPPTSSDLRHKNHCHPQPRLSAHAAHCTVRIPEPRRADAAPACGIFVRGDAHVELRLLGSPPFVHAHLVQPAAPDLRSDGATDIQRLREEHPLPLLGALHGVLDAVLVALDHVDQQLGRASCRERVCQSG